MRPDIFTIVARYTRGAYQEPGPWKYAGIESGLQDGARPSVRELPQQIGFGEVDRVVRRGQRATVHIVAPLLLVTGEVVDVRQPQEGLVLEVVIEVSGAEIGGAR